MAAVSELSPFDLLLDIERRSRGYAMGLPLQVEERSLWSGVGFRLRGVRLVAPMDEVREILTYPRLSVVPGAKQWVKGIANVRGNLLPILDLQGCVGGESNAITRRSRVLVVSHGDVTAGLVVDEVLGMKHFDEDERSNTLPEVPASLDLPLSGAYQQGGVCWGIVDIVALVTRPAFMQVGL